MINKVLVRLIAFTRLTLQIALWINYNEAKSVKDFATLFLIYLLSYAIKKRQIQPHRFDK